MSIAQKALRLVMRPLLNERYRTGMARCEVVGQSRKQGMGGVAVAATGGRRNLAGR